MSTTIKSRRGTTAALTTADPTPARGEIVVEYDAAVSSDADVVSVRIGDGERPWSELSPIGGGGGVSDHGALTGLGDDDHPQYHNDARGDARYWPLATDLATQAEVDAAIVALINGAPGALDTLDELAAAFGDDANFVTTVTNALALKAPLASPALTGTPTVPTAAPGTDTTQAASTAFVQAASGTTVPLPAGTVAGDVGKVLSLTDESPVTTDWVGTLRLFNVKDYGAVGDNATNDTVAIQAAIDAAVAAGGGTVYFPTGIYLASGAQVTGTTGTPSGSYSGQLLLPARNITSSRLGLRFLGDTQAPMLLWGPQVGQNEPVHLTGSIIRSTATTGAVFDVIPGTNAGAVSAYSNLHVHFENLTVRLPVTPGASALRMQAAGAFRIDGCAVDVNASAATVGTTAPGAGTYGIYAPASGNAAHVSIADTYVAGYDVGIRHSEHTILDNVVATLCNVGFQPAAANHDVRYLRAMGVCNVRHLQAVVGTSYISGTLDMESKASGGGGWYVTVEDIDDPSNRLKGTLLWHKVISGVGVSSSIIVDGATNLSLRELRNEKQVDEAVIGIACSDETTAITTGTGKVTFRMPYAMTLRYVRASLTTASTAGGPFTVDINEGGTTILSTKLTIDDTEKTSVTGAAAVISDTALADDAEITIDVDDEGTGAKGLKVYLIGTKIS